MPENLQRVGFLVTLPALMREHGAEPIAALNEADLPSDCLDHPENTIPYFKMGRLIRAAVDLTGCQHLGLLIGERAGAASLGLISELMSHAPDLGTALGDLVGHQHRHARGAVIYLLPHEKDVVFGYSIYQTDVEAAAQLYDGAAALAVSMIRKLTGDDRLDRAEVLLSRAPPHDLEPYHRYFGLPLHFNCGLTGVSIPSSWMKRTVLGANPLRRSRLEGKIASYWKAGDYDFVAQLRRALSRGLHTDQIAGDDLARYFQVSRRTLDRRLQEQNLTFQQVLDETRFEYTKQLLQNTMLSIGQISAILRFADQSVFTRSFKRWAGITPRDWRRGRTQ